MSKFFIYPYCNCNSVKQLIAVLLIYFLFSFQAIAQTPNYVNEGFVANIPYNTANKGLRVTTTDWLQKQLQGGTVAPNDFEWINAGTNPVAANQNISGLSPGAGFVRYINRTVAYPAVSGAANGDAALLISRSLDFSGHTIYNAAADTFGISIFRDGSAAVTNVLDYVEVYINTNPTLTGATLLTEKNSGATKIYRSSIQSPVSAGGWKRYYYTIPNNADYVSVTGGTSNAYIIVAAYSAGGNNIYLDNFNFPQWLTPMIVQSATLFYQDDNDIEKNTTNNLLLGVKIITKGSTVPLKLDGVTFSSNGSTNWLGDVVTNGTMVPPYCHTYFTGGTASFITSNGAVSIPFNSFTGPGNGLLNFGWWAAGCAVPATPATMTLNPGSENYVWFAVDVKATATQGNNVGADFQFATVRPGGICTFFGNNISSTNLSTNPIPPQTLNKHRPITSPYTIPPYTAGTANTPDNCISAVELVGDSGTQIKNYDHDFACSTCLATYPSPQYCIRLACDPPSYTNFAPVNQGTYMNRFVHVTEGYGKRTGGLPYTLKAQAGLLNNNNNIAVFIDWNHDGDFDDKYMGTTGVPTQDAAILENYGTHSMLNGDLNSYPVTAWPANTSWTIDVPLTTDVVTDLNDPTQLPNNSVPPLYSGNVRMRIREVFSVNNINPFATYTYGEAEDYTLKVLNDCPLPASNYCKWIGNTSDWNNPNNWCPSIPTINKDAVIPLLSAPFFYPLIKDNTTAVCNNLKIQSNASGSGAQLNIDATQNSSLTVAGDLIIGNGAPLTGSAAILKNTFSQTITIPGKSVAPPAGVALITVTPFRTNAHGKTQIAYTATELINTYGWKANDVIDQLSIEVASISGGAGISNYQDFRIVAYLTSQVITYQFPPPPSTKIAVAAGDPNVISGWPKTIFSANPLTLNMPNPTMGTKNNGNYATFDLIPNTFIWDGTTNLVLSFEYKTTTGSAPAKSYVLYNESNASFTVLALNCPTVGSVITGYNIDGAGHYTGGSSATVTANVSNQRPRLDFTKHHIYQTFPITVGGNWINNGNNAGGFIPERSNVIFNGNTDVTITGDTTTFNQLTIDKSANAKKVSLYADINVDSVFTLNKGRLRLEQQVLTVNNNAANAIVKNAGVIVSESQNAPYGCISWNIGTNYVQHVFPFATNTGTYIPFNYKQNSGNAGYVKASTYKSNANNLPYPTGVTNVNDTNGVNNKAYTVDRYWSVTRTGATGKAQLKFSYKNTEAPAPISAGNLEADRYDFSTNIWERFTNTQTNNTGTTVSSLVINNVSALNLVDGVWALSDISNPLRITSSALQPFAEVYPNPFNDFVKVNFENNENPFVEYVIYDATLRGVSKGKLLPGETFINTQQLAPGTYIIELNTNEQKQQQKMVKF